MFVRRFLFDPGAQVLLNIESVNILDLSPPSAITGIGTGAVLLVGEFENGPYNTVTEVSSADDLQNNFGSLGFTYGGVPGNYPCSVARKADAALSPEYWNGNGFVQLNGKQFARLIICRVDTSVGSVQLTPQAFVTGGASFRYVLAAGQVLGLDVGAGAQTATFTATAATVTGSGATYVLSAGDSLVVGADGMPNVTVVFLASDNGSQSNIISRINQYAGFTFASNTGGQLTFTGVQQGSQAQVRIVSGSAGVLTALGLTAATTFGTGNVANILAVTPGEVKTVVEAAISNSRVEVDQNGALRISNTLGIINSFVRVTSATTATALGFTAGQLGTYMGVACVISSSAVSVSQAGTFSMAIDNGIPFTVTLAGSETLSQAVTAINTGAGKTVAYTDGSSLLAIFGATAGGNINIISASVPLVLQQLGLAPGVYAGSPISTGVIPAGTVVQNTAATRVLVTTQDIAFGSTGVTIGGVNVATLGPWTVKVRHAVDDGTGLSATTATITTVPVPPLLYSVACNNPSPLSAALSESAIDAAYVVAFNATLDINTVAKQVNLVYSARQSNTVRRQMKSNVLSASANGCFGRMGFMRTPMGTTKANAQSVTAEPGVGAYRDQRIVFCFPQARSFVPIIAQRGTAGGQGFSPDGNVDIGADGFAASICSQLPPEENPGQETGFTTAIVSLESSPNAQGFTMQDYINFKALGICALRIDDGTAVFQSGVTSVDPSVYPNLTRISRRRMADFIQDTLAQRLKGFGKKLSTVSRRAAIVSEIRSFMDDLAKNERIDSYSISIKANTPTTLGQGMFRIVLNVRTLASLDSIVLQTTTGEQVDTTEQLAA